MSDATFASCRIDELPSFFNGPQGRAWAAGMGQAQDDQLAVARVAALSRLPFKCPDDALDAAGAWLLLPRFPGEPNGTAPTAPGKTDGAGYRGRLCVAWTTWKVAATKQAVISSLQAWGVPDVAVQNAYEADPPFPGNWWSAYRVVLGPNFGAYGWHAGDDPTVSQQQQMAAQVLFWKWAYAYPVEILLIGAAGYMFTVTIGALLDYNFVWDVSHYGGFETL